MGRLAESTFGAALADGSSLLAHHRPRLGSTAEIDYILSVGSHGVSVEVNHQRNLDLNRYVIAEPTNLATFGTVITRRAAVSGVPSHAGNRFSTEPR